LAKEGELYKYQNPVAARHFLDSDDKSTSAVLPAGKLQRIPDTNAGELGGYRLSAESIGSLPPQPYAVSLGEFVPFDLYQDAAEVLAGTGWRKRKIHDSKTRIQFRRRANIRSLGCRFQQREFLHCCACEKNDSGRIGPAI